MKYETTQGQYTDFLNSLKENQSGQLFLDTYNHIDYRLTITIENGKYVCYRPDRACNFLDQHRPLTLADWMGLRLISELEYEKAARGPLSPKVGELAWGASDQTAQELISIEGVENGTEAPLPDNANYHFSSNNLVGGDGDRGPVRTGIFARENSNRTLSGASYYGVMELSGNLADVIVCIIKNVEPNWYYYPRGFQYFSGDGEIDSVFTKANSFKNLKPNGDLINFYTQPGLARHYKVSSVSYGFIFNQSWCYGGVRLSRNAPDLP